MVAGKEKILIYKVFRRRGHSHITLRKGSGGGVFIFVTKCDKKGVGGLFLEYDVTFGLKIASLALFVRKNLAHV